MDTYKRRLGMDIAVDESDGLFASRIGPNPPFETHNAEMSPSRGEIGFGDLADWRREVHGLIISELSEWHFRRIFNLLVASDEMRYTLSSDLHLRAVLQEHVPQMRTLLFRFSDWQTDFPGYR